VTEPENQSTDAVEIRFETPVDHRGVYEVNEQAFGGTDEAELVEKLRKLAGPPISIVASDGERIVGHILFTPVKVVGDGEPFRAMALAPMAVEPSRQRRGIGGRLVRAGLDACREIGEKIVFVIGHPEYYPRFGFRPAAPLGFRNEFGAPDDAFLVIELVPGAVAGRSGTVLFLSPFSADP